MCQQDPELARVHVVKPYSHGKRDQTSTKRNTATLNLSQDFTPRHGVITPNELSLSLSLSLSHLGFGSVVKTHFYKRTPSSENT